MRSARPAAMAAAAAQPGLRAAWSWKAARNSATRSSRGKCSTTSARKAAGQVSGVAAADIEPGRLAQEMALDVERGIDLRPHVPDDDLLDAGAALRWPTRA